MQVPKLIHCLTGIVLAVSSFVLQAEEALTIDPAWQQGKLANGFHWEILPTPQRPNDKVAIRLVINSGSLNEDNLQQGFNHLLSQIAMLQSTALDEEAQRQLWKQSLGSADALPPVINSYEFTQYNLSVAADDKKNLNNALVWLASTAGQLNVSESTIQAALASSDSTATWPANTHDVWWRYRLRHSVLEQHNPDDPVNMPVNLNQLKAFYQQWYTPDAMTLYVVGNVDSRAVIEQINKQFMGLSGSRSSPSQIAVLNPLDHDAVNLRDERYQKARFSIIWDGDWKPIQNVKSLYDYWTEQLVTQAVLASVSDDLADPHSLKMGCHAFYMRAFCTVDLNTDNADLEKESQKLSLALGRLKRNGLTQLQYKSLIEKQHNWLDMLYSSWATMPTTTLLERRLIFVRNQVADIAPEQYQKLRKAYLQMQTREQLNQHIQQTLSQPASYLVIQPPQVDEIPATKLSAKFNHQLASSLASDNKESTGSVNEP